MATESHRDRDAPEFIDGAGDRLEVYPTAGGTVCIRQTRGGGDYPSIWIRPENIEELVKALRLVGREAEAWAAEKAAKDI